MGLFNVQIHLEQVKYDKDSQDIYLKEDYSFLTP